MTNPLSNIFVLSSLLFSFWSYNQIDMPLTSTTVFVDGHADCCPNGRTRRDATKKSSISTDSLPGSIMHHLDKHFSGYELDANVRMNSVDNTTAVFGIEAEDHQEDDAYLMYDQRGTFLYEAKEASARQLPPAVRNSIQTQYTSYAKRDDILILNWSNGRIEYLVRMKHQATSADMYVVFAKDGTVS
ncbi:MAG: hypothetical protein AAF206_10045, partial [Bacteroidota bacterium]